MTVQELKQELKKKYGHVIGSKQIETAAEHFESEIKDVDKEPKKWSMLSLLRLSRFDEESGVAATFIMRLTGYKGGVLVVKAPVYGTIKVALRGERLILLQNKPRELMKRVVECVEYANEYDPFEDELGLESRSRSTMEFSLSSSQLETDPTAVDLIARPRPNYRELLASELKERVPLLVATSVVKFTLVERTYVSTPGGEFRRVGETKTPVEFRATPNELRQGHERAANMKINASKTAAELKKPLKGEKLWAYRYHSC